MFRILSGCLWLLAPCLPANAAQPDQEAVARVIEKTRECEDSVVVTALPKPFDRWLSLSCSSRGQLVMGKTARKGEHFVARRSIAPMNIYEEMNPQTRSERISEGGMQAVNFSGFEGLQLPSNEAAKYKSVFRLFFDGYEPDNEDEVWLLQMDGQSEERMSFLALLIDAEELKYAIYLRGAPQNTRVFMTIDEDEWQRRFEKRNTELEAMIARQKQN